jgi:hypothetical protein
MALTSDLRHVVQRIRELPRYMEHDVQRRSSMQEYFDAEQVEELLDALCLDVPARQDQETKEDTRVDDGQPRRIAPTGSTASTDGGS